MGIGVGQMKHLNFQDWCILGFILFVVGVFSYANHLDNQKPNCPAFDPKDVGTKLTSHDLGSVDINGETCHVIEVTQHSCYVDHYADYYSECKGEHLFCSNSVISRITKCPSGT